MSAGWPWPRVRSGWGLLGREARVHAATPAHGLPLVFIPPQPRLYPLLPLEMLQTPAGFCWLPSLAGGGHTELRQVEARGKALPASPGCHCGRVLQERGWAQLGARAGGRPLQSGHCLGDSKPGARAGERTPSGRPRVPAVRVEAGGAVTVGQVTGTDLMASPGGRGSSKVMEGGSWEDWLQRKGLRA